MIQIHDIFVCKPGNASKVAKLFKEVMAESKEVKKIMTDVTGQYNRVIMVSEFDNLTDYEKMMEGYKNPTEEQKKQYAKMHGYTEMYLTGSREIFQVW